MLGQHALGPGRPPHQIAAAVGAKPAQPSLGAVRAEGAFVGADEYVRRCRVEVPVAALAVRSQFKHVPSIAPGPARREGPHRFLLLSVLVLPGADEAHGWAHGLG